MLVKGLGYGYCLAYVLALVSWPGSAYPTNSYRDLDICNHWNGRRHFLELGERGELHARNVSNTAYRVSAGRLIVVLALSIETLLRLLPI